MCILIYDIDGTLSYVYGDIPDSTGFDTYAFWPLISHHFTSDSIALKKSIASWEESMKIEVDPTGSSHKMMQDCISTFVSTVCAHNIREYAKTITLKFIACGVLREKAIRHLAHNLELGNTCVFSTGSYQDGAYGFVDGLVEGKLLSPVIAQKILVSGAIVDWDKRILVHANVREKKIAGLEHVFKKDIQELKGKILAVFADDPFINDRDILMLSPKNKAYVIQTNKNRDRPIPDSYKCVTWEEIIGS